MTIQFTYPPTFARKNLDSIEKSVAQAHPSINIQRRGSNGRTFRFSGPDEEVRAVARALVQAADTIKISGPGGVPISSIGEA